MVSETVVISTRIPRGLASQADEVARSSYLNSADFFRDAIRKAVFERGVSEIKAKLAKDKDSVKAVRAFRKLESNLFTDDEIAAMSREEAKKSGLREEPLP